MKKEEKLRKEQNKSNSAALHLATEMEVDEHENLNSPTQSEHDMIDTLKNVTEGQKSERHQKLKSELKIRMILAKEKIKNRKGNDYAKRLEDLQHLYESYSQKVLKQPESGTFSR